jgi:SAM-dependent methyltransferase
MPVVPVDVVDDGERLHTFADESQDFIIANHFLEHTQDPIGTLRRFVAVLKPSGVLYHAVPDKRFTFDAERPLTPLEHMIRDHDQGPEWSYRDHVSEFTRLVQRLEGEAAEKHVRTLIADNYSIHFHVWTHETFLRFLFDVRDRYAMPFTLEANVLNRTRDETIVILRKRDPDREPIEP